MKYFAFSFLVDGFIESVEYRNWREDKFERERGVELFGIVTGSDQDLAHRLKVEMRLSDESLEGTIEETDFCFDKCTIYEDIISLSSYISRYDLNNLKMALKDSRKGLSNVEIECQVEINGEVSTESVCNREEKRIVALSIHFNYLRPWTKKF